MTTAKRRTSDDGSVSWRVLWRNGGRAGKSESVTFADTAYPRGTARRLATRAAQLVDAHSRHIDRLTVYHSVLGIEAATESGDTADAWFTEWASTKVGVENGTLHTYRGQWRRRMSPTFGHLPLAAIDRTVITNWVADLSKQVQAPTVHRHHALLHQVLDAAVAAGKIPTNPAARTGLPKVRHGVIRDQRVFLTRHEADLLLAAFRSPWARDLVDVLLRTGMRWGEATALQAGDIDRGTDPPRVRVERAWKKHGRGWELAEPGPDDDELREMGTWALGAPKSHRSRRTITVPARIVTVLDRHADLEQPASLVFRNGNGQRVDHSNFMRDHWRPALAAARGFTVAGRPVPRAAELLRKLPTPHSCRHSHAAWLLSDGFPIVRVSRRLGHDSITTTDAFYGHLTPLDDSDITDAL